MGSLDVSGGKQQFFKLVDAMSASHLPSFIIWLDAKLAEYKTVGQLKPDSEYESKEQYPEWIGKALRQNLSFLFPGPSQTASSGKDDTPTNSPDVRKRRASQTSDIGSEKKRSKPSFGGGRSDCAEDDDSVIVVKEEPGGRHTSDDLFSRVTETPLPGIQSTFSLSTEPIKDFASGQSAPFPFVTPSKNIASSPATMTPPNHTTSLPHPSLSINTSKILGSSSKAFNFDNPSSHSESIPIFSPSAVAKKVEPSQQLSSSAGEASVSYPVMPGAQSSDAEGSEGPASTISDEAVQDIIRRYHGGKPTYAVPKSLILDLRNQSGLYVCPLCEKPSESVPNYRKHFVTHTKERPFACPYCPSMCRNSSNILSHQRLMHSDMPVVKVTPNMSNW